jgi:D-alanine-D-alanine ligase
MRIALTHNLRLTDSEEEAEFDTETTVSAIAGALERLGHRVERIEVSGPASRIVARLEAFAPDLVFNTAEGRRGRFREAFYPAMFEELGLPFTGSDAYSLALTLDKQLCKLILRQHGIQTPAWQYVEESAELAPGRFRFPVIVKPNFEGSSKGITQASIVEDARKLKAFVENALKTYPAGVLVEEYIAGRDITVPFLEAVKNARNGILAPVEYVIDPKASETRKYPIYDYELKTKLDSLVSVRTPAEMPLLTLEHITRASQVVFRELNCRDLGRLDFRLSDDGHLYFLEINALPSLEPGAGIYAAAALEGLDFDGVICAVVRSAQLRQGLLDSQRRQSKPARRSGPLKIGFTFNVKRVTPLDENGDDSEAEYDSPKTLRSIREAIASHGHEVIDLEATNELPQHLATAAIDVVFNIAEGLRGRNREAHVPALCELLDIPYTGSDPATLAIALDKALTKRVLAPAGVATPESFVLATGKDRIPRELLKFPLIVKPVAEGSSKGVHTTSVVHSENELRQVAKEMIGRYQQPALVEEYVTGREFTVGLLGERRPRVLPPMEIVFTDKTEAHPVYSFAHKLAPTDKVKYEVPANLTPSEQREVERVSRLVFMTLGCRDVARVDVRLQPNGRVVVLECNPLPGLTPGWSDLCLIAQAAGIDYRTLIGEILAGAIRRYKERVRGRRTEREVAERTIQPPAELLAGSTVAT